MTSFYDTINVHSFQFTIFIVHSSSGIRKEYVFDLFLHLILFLLYEKYKLSFRKLTLLSVLRNIFVVRQVIAVVIFTYIQFCDTYIFSQFLAIFLWLQHFCKLDLVVFMWYNLWHLILSFLAI